MNNSYRRSVGYKNIGVTISGVIVMSGWGDKQVALNNKAKEILAENEIEWYGSTDFCRYWITVFQKDEKKAKALLKELL